jgi:hypothetical protein
MTRAISVSPPPALGTIQESATAGGGVSQPFGLRPPRAEGSGTRYRFFGSSLRA